MKKNKGITLIALIITIIIMIILVAVSVSILINSGLIGKAKEGADKTKTAYEQEQRIGENITINGVVYNSIDEYIATLDNGNNEINWVEVLATAQKHPDQQNSEAIGIGTDGNPVNLDLWTYCVINTNEIMMSGGGTGVWGYSNSNIIDGKIQGTVPQYIKVDGENEFYVVTSMNGTFYGCKSLTTAPKIPDTVTDMYQAFANCTSLTTAPALPSSVTNLSYTFYECSSLTEAPEIPNSVTNMYITFSGCSSLTGDLVINANPTDYRQCLEDAATNSGCNLKLSGTSTVLSQILATKSSNSNISLKN